MRDATSACLTLEELVARAAGGADPGPHLTGCARCQDEVRRWRAVADGVRQAAPADPPPPQPLHRALAVIDGERAGRGGLRQGGPRWGGARWGGALRGGPLRGGPRRRVSLLSAAAAVVLAGSAAYALSGQGTPAATPAPATTPATARATVAAAAVYSTDCADVKVAAGTLESVSGSSLVLKAADGTAVTVRADASTKITHQVEGELGEIGEGTRVLVRGRGGERVAAERIGIAPESMKLPGLPRLGGGLDLARRMAANGTVMGTVSRVRDGGLTVRAGDGTEIEVDTSASTRVFKQEDTGVDGLGTGEYTVVVGVLERDGVLSARRIQQDSPPDGTTPSFGPLPGTQDGPPGSQDGPPGSQDGLPDDPPGLRDGLPGLRDGLPGGVPAPGGLSDKLFDGLGCDSDTLAGTAMYGAGA